MARTDWWQKLFGRKSQTRQTEPHSEPRLRRSRGRRLFLEPLEERVAPDASPLLHVIPDGGPNDLTLRLSGPDLQLVDTGTGDLLASQALADTSAVEVTGADGANDTLRIDFISVGSFTLAGGIAFDGRDVTHLPMPARARLGIARTFQITQVLSRFSALENVALAAQAGAGSSFRFWRPAAD